MARKPKPAPPEVVYLFKERPLCIKGAKTANAQKIGESLAEIKRLNNGRMGAKTIVRAATDNANYLHRHFEWNDEICGRRHRLDQARELAACIDTVFHNERGEEKIIPAFISLNDDVGASYRSSQEIFDSTDLQVLALRACERDLDSFARRFMRIAEVCDALQEARAKIKARRERMEAERPGSRPSA